jgi:hypothetical protein
MMHAYAYANANAMQLRTKHLKCYRIDLVTQGLAKKVVLALLSGFVVSLLNIILCDMVFIYTNESLPS